MRSLVLLVSVSDDEKDAEQEAQRCLFKSEDGGGHTHGGKTSPSVRLESISESPRKLLSDDRAQSSS